MSEGGFVRVLSEFRGLAESNPDVRFFLFWMLPGMIIHTITQIVQDVLL